MSAVEVLDCHEKWFAELHGVVEEKEEAAAKIREIEHAAAGDGIYDEIRECKRHKKDPDKAVRQELQSIVRSPSRPLCATASQLL